MIIEKLKKNKFAFSLFEVVVTMAIVSIFIAACTNVFTQKYKKKVSLPNHGRFECYYNSEGVLTERLVSESVVSEKHPVDGYCTFVPLKSAAYFVINAVGAGGAGGTQFGGAAGADASIFLPTTTHTMYVYPGEAAKFDSTTNTTTAARGGTTKVIDQISHKEIIVLLGGRSNSGSKVDFESCSVSYAKYTCRLSPYCNIDNENSRFQIGYCSASSTDVSAEKSLNLSYTDFLRSYSGSSTSDLSQDTLTYLHKDFLLTAYMSGNYTQLAQESRFKLYISALRLDSGIAVLDPSPGTGGALKRDGGTGAVIIAW